MVGFAAAPTAIIDGETQQQQQQQQYSSLAEIVYSHFESHQRSDTNNNNTNNASRAAAALRHELLSFSDGDDEEDGDGCATDEISAAVVNCLDAAMAAVAASSKKDAWSDSVSSAVELAAAFAASSSSSISSSSKDDDNNDGAVAEALIRRAAEFSAVEKDAIRIESCKLLGMCVGNLAEGSKPAAGILKKKKKKKGRGSDKKETEAAVTASADGRSGEWKVTCLLLASEALLPRITDRIAKVRGAAIAACNALLNERAARQFFRTRESTASEEIVRAQFEDALKEIQDGLLWLMANDSSAANRSLIASVLPLGDCIRGYENNVAPVIERIGDVDVKVREAALDALREGVRLEDLEEDARVEILRMGLTKRCPTTYAKTVELLTTSWLKSTKFDPLLLLEKLNPTLNETVCEQVSQVLLKVASMIDCETLSSGHPGALERGVVLVQSHFGAPEVRELRNVVLRKMAIYNVEDGRDKDAKNEENDEDAEEGFGDNDSTSKPKCTIKPARAIFLRVKCELASQTNNTATISDVINDIPSLCNLLNTHIDSLIEFNSSEDYEDLDEDDAATYEDEMNFVCLQLIHMAKASELSEEGSRRHFISIMRRVLARLATPDDLVEACVKAMAAAHDKESQFLQTISEILVDVEDDDTFQHLDEKATIIVRQMRIIAILSIVLESITGQLSGHPILDGFFEHLSPAIFSKNAIVREHGVICLSKFCLLSDEEKVMGEFKPLLMTIAGSVEERAEVRAQAALALCDLALIHERMLLAPNNSSSSAEEGSEEGNAKSMPFKDMLLEMLGHSKPGIVIIAAEIAAKLLLAGRLRDPTLIAWLVLIYFDTSLTALDLDEDDADGNEVKEVGSPVRLQQLLSIFFPTYSMSSLDANDDLMECVGPLLSIVNDKLLSGINEIGASSKAMMARWPIGKMVEYVCYNVDLADKKKNEEGNGSEKVEQKTETVEDGEPDLGDAGETDVEDGNGSEAAENDAKPEEEEDDIVEASSTLLASIDISAFLAEQSDDDTPTFYTRVLAKILGSACIDVEVEDVALLRRLKLNANEAEYAHDDGYTVRDLKKLTDLLICVEDVSFEEEAESASEEEDDAEEKEVTNEEDDAVDGNVSLEKENPRLSMGSVKSTSKQNAEVDRRLSNRTSLGDVNCN